MNIKRRVVLAGVMFGLSTASSALLVGCTEKKSFQSFVGNREALLEQETIKDREGLNQLLEVMVRYTQPSQSLESLYAFLLESEQSPQVFGDPNDLIGDAYFIRTDSPPPGTRYFQVLYEDFGEGPEIRHMSFEYRKGKGALKEVLEEISKTFSGAKRSSELDEEFSGFIVWDLPNGYTLWVKELDAFDVLEGHPVNAYSEEDVGVIRVAIEVNPHS